MSAAHPQAGSFEKVGECLYRYTSNGVYYAVARNAGKLIRKSLETSDKTLAKRELADLRETLGGTDHQVGRK